MKKRPREYDGVIVMLILPDESGEYQE